ncbi:MAG TPA: twin-arginine translocase TatA/TatE family subunit [Desulfatiglandales bacterium]|nr:twin-arginine translocase TatA/TatE family subunit [Desulfatiglandales bacterium]
MFGLGTTEIIIIGVIIVFIFGAKRLPEIGKGLGGAIREFRNIKKDATPDEQNEGSRNAGKEEKSIENKLADKVVEDIPILKKGLEVKEKVEKIKDITK